MVLAELEKILELSVNGLTCPLYNHIYKIMEVLKSLGFVEKITSDLETAYFQITQKGEELIKLIQELEKL